MEEFICKYCGKKFSNKGGCINHEKHWCKKNPNVEFIDYKQSEAHIGLRKEGGWNCICGDNFPTRRILQEHKSKCIVYQDALKKQNCGNSKFAHPQIRVDKDCPFCGKHLSTTQSGFTKHTNTCSKNPNRVFYKGHSPDTSTREKISEKMKEHYKDCSIWSTQIEKRKSYAEQYFDNIFPELEQNYHALRYFLDLADPKKKLYMEIDGEQHYNDLKVVKHDEERTKLLEEDGWILIDRIRWSDFQKLSEDGKKDKINELKSKFNSMNNIAD